jgi:hypothetical protein
MYVKMSMKEVHRAALSEHERKRCRIESRGNPWQVWEEDILWWSLDRASWQPVYDELWQQRRRRWLMVEAEDGTYPALLWDVTEGVQIPSEATAPPTGSEPAYNRATSDFERLYNRR